MRQGLFQVAGTTVMLALAGCARTPPVPPPTVATAQIQAPDTTGDAALLTATARVVSVDHENRTVRLRGPRGRTFTVDVSPEVRNFDQIRAGDNVVLHYYESVAYTLAKPGTAVADDSVATGAAAAQPGALPGGLVARRITVTGLVTAIDQDAHTITVVDPRGSAQQTFHVTNPQRQEDMRSVKVGDTITATITQAVAVAVEPASPNRTTRARHRSAPAASSS